MKKKLTRCAAVLSMIPIITLTACGGNSPFELNLLNEVGTSETKETERPVLAAEMNEAYINFSIELFKKSLTKGENSLISPASVEFALTMALNGADGDTLTEMLTVLCPGATTEDINTFVQDLDSMLTYSQGANFHIANSVWSNEEVLGNCLNETYADTLSANMDAEAHMLPFDENAVKEINEWVNTNTDGMIPTLLTDIPDSAVMYLINAMAFEGEWEEAYKEGQIEENSTFTNAEGKEETATMLRDTGEYYLENKNATGFIRYYEGREYAFMAMLPKDEGTIEDFVAEITAKDYTEFYKSLTTQYDVITKLPCFSYSYDVTMNDALTEMGMPTAFTEGQADFSPMVTDENVNLFINRVMHKTFIELDENGTKAAAVTSIEMCDNAVSIEEPKEVKEVILDRPFVYAIVDAETGIPVFLGTLNSVE